MVQLRRKAALRQNKNLKTPSLNVSGNCNIAYGLACFVRYSLKQSNIKLSFDLDDAASPIGRYSLKQSNIKLSFERLREELSFVQSSIVKDTKTGRRFRLPSRATATQRAIYGVFNKKINQTVQFL